MSSVKIKVGKKVREFLSHGTSINTPTKKYNFLPYWFEEEKGKEGVFIVHSLGKLPKELEDLIENMRYGPPFSGTESYLPTTKEDTYEKR